MRGDAGAGEVKVGMPTIESLLLEIREGQREIREGQAAHRDHVQRALESFSGQCHEMNVEQARQGERLAGACEDISELKAAVSKLQPNATQHGINAAGGGIGGAIVLGLMALWERMTSGGGHP